MVKTTVLYLIKNNYDHFSELLSDMNKIIEILLKQGYNISIFSNDFEIGIEYAFEDEGSFIYMSNEKYKGLYDREENGDDAIYNYDSN